MAEVQSIHPADLRRIESELEGIYDNMDLLNGHVNAVDSKVKVVYNEISSLAKEFKEYVQVAERQHQLSVAETRLVKIRQELEKKYGHYDQVRRTTTGILQADDLGIIKKDTISMATEELMITTPNYWLTPCLIALAAWINNQPELSEKALKEGIKRDDEKTSLLFSLICRRAGRKEACLKWTRRYLENQDEENLDRKCIVILDAFASGLLGADSEGLVSKQIEEWIDYLSEKPGFIEQQVEQWSEAINLKRKPLKENYYYLKKYSKTWPQLQDVLEGAHLHETIFKYFENIFNQEVSSESVKIQLDEILDSLVQDYDNEEVPLRKKEKLNQFIVDFKGDTARAQAKMDIEESAFALHKDFTQLLTDAAMKPESTHSSVSTQKFSIALSREWILNAYNDVIAKNRMKVPHEIEINVDTFNDKTLDGEDEREILSRFSAHISSEKEKALSDVKVSSGDKIMLVLGIIAIPFGALIVIMINILLALFFIVPGIIMVIRFFTKRSEIMKTRENIKNQFEENLTGGSQIIRAWLAEVVDYRSEFKEWDIKSQNVIDFLNQISPEQYVRRLAETTRKIKRSS